MNRINVLVLGTGMAILALISFQYYWIKTSKSLIEEQFTNKVSMALCSAVDKLSDNPDCCKLKTSGCEADNTQCQSQLNSMVQDSAFVKEINSSLQFYNIRLPYELAIKAKDSVSNTYSCSLSPILSKDDHWVQLMFKEKSAFSSRQLFPMWMISLLIIGAVIGLLAFATHSLYKQQRIAKENIRYFNHMTHEFSTPLTNIQLASSLIQKSSLEDKIHQYTHVITDQSKQLKSQIENVLLMASVDQSGFSLHKTQVKLTNVVHEVIDSMQLQIHDKKAEINIMGSNRDVSILADVFHIKNAIRNLIDNALKYCQRPKIDIEVKADKTMSSIHFTDNGPGIDKDQKQKVFDPFYRISQANDQKGFGLGLAYVKKIVEMHQGYIQLQTSSHHGSIFSLYFPHHHDLE